MADAKKSKPLQQLRPGVQEDLSVGALNTPPRSTTLKWRQADPTPTRLAATTASSYEPLLGSTFIEPIHPALPEGAYAHPDYPAYRDLMRTQQLQKYGAGRADLTDSNYQQFPGSAQNALDYSRSVSNLGNFPGLVAKQHNESDTLLRRILAESGGR